MTQKVTRKMFIERMNAATNELREYANRQVETINVRHGDYTTIRSIGKGASILRNDKRNDFSIDHTYLDDMIFISADEAEQMAWELLSAACELRRIEREHAAENKNA